MRICEQPCMDCPYLRDSSVIEDADAFYKKHTTIMGAYEPYVCPEQGDLCLGQAKTIVNNTSSYLVLDVDFRELLEATKPDYENYFLWGFIRHHEGRSLPPSPRDQPVQGSLF